MGGNEFSDSRLEEVLYHSRALSVETLGVKVIDHVHEFAGEAPQSDDITCLVMRYQPSEGPGERAAPVRPTVSTDQIVVRIANDLSELAPLAGIVEEFCERNEMPMKLAFNLKLALDEMITNTVSYGYEDGEKHTIEVRIMREGDTFTVELEDDAQAYNPLEAPEADLEAEIDDRPIGGLGVHLVRTIMDTVNYRRDGDRNLLIMSKKGRDEEESEEA